VLAVRPSPAIRTSARSAVGAASAVVGRRTVTSWRAVASTRFFLKQPADRQHSATTRKRTSGHAAERGRPHAEELGECWRSALADNSDQPARSAVGAASGVGAAGAVDRVGERGGRRRGVGVE
jgi:hypothetical protein